MGRGVEAQLGKVGEHTGRGAGIDHEAAWRHATTTTGTNKRVRSRFDRLWCGAVRCTVLSCFRGGVPSARRRTWSNMRNMEEEGWWMVLTTVWPLLARFFMETISPSDVEESRPR